MRKDVDTHFFAVRQVLLLGPAGGDLPPVVAAALPLPRYIVHTAREPAGAVQVIARSKIEVVVFGVVDPAEAPPAVEQMKAADRDVEVVLVLDAEATTRMPAGLLAVCDVVSRPVSPVALAARVERARERRFLLRAEERRQGAFPIAMSVTALPLADQPLYGVLIEDRTRAQRLEVELRQAQRLEAVGQLAAGLAHEINTPCQYIGSSAAAVRAAFADLEPLLARYDELLGAARSAAPLAPLLDEAAARAEEQIDECDLESLLHETARQLAAIEEGARRIATIVQGLGEFSRAHWPAEATLDVNRSVRSVLAVLEHELRPVADLVLEVQPLPAIQGRGGELNQALFNIVRNAIEAMARRGAGRGRLLVRTCADGDAVLVTVGDTGDGIAEPIRTRIFDPFFTTKEVGRGTGQGLAVAWSVIVDRHGGSLTFDSQPTQGTTFTVRLPLKPKVLQASCG